MSSGKPTRRRFPRHIRIEGDALQKGPPTVIRPSWSLDPVARGASKPWMPGNLPPLPPEAPEVAPGWRPPAGNPAPDMAAPAGDGFTVLPDAPDPTPEPQLVPPGALVMTPEELDAFRDQIISELRQPYAEAARALRNAAIELEQRLHEDVVDLAAKLAENLVHRHVKIDRELMVETARQALRMAGPLERVTVKCNADDAEILRQCLPDLAQMEAGRPVEVLVRPSDDIGAGGCLLTFEGGIVDARVTKRMQRIVDVVKAAVSEAAALPEPSPVEPVVATEEAPS